MNLSILGRRRNAKRAPGPGTATRAGATLFDQPGSEAQTTMLPAPGPATDVSGPRTDTMPKIPALPQRRPAAPHEVAFGEAAEIFGTNPHGVATTETLEAIRAQVAAGSRDAAGDRYGDLTRSDLPPSMARAYAQPPAPDMTRIEQHAAPLRVAEITAASSRVRMAVLSYPPYGAPREQWAACLRQVGAYTGTSTGAEYHAPREVVLAWTPQRPARLAIEAPKKVAA